MLPAPTTLLSPIVTPRKNDRAASDPHVAAYTDRARRLQTDTPGTRIGRVLRGVELKGRTDLRISPQYRYGHGRETRSDS